ncbi:condensation domain-containing protein, partial [Pilimelia anulata]|uniref:condensation domain-containing protein n=1 Tax=Pilimelia anulata TaxID=53371 RepID=UPI00166BABC3
MSSAQRRLWFLYRYEGPSATYNIPVLTRLHGPVDVPALRAAVGDLMARHDILRTVYGEADGEPGQRVLPIADTPVDFAAARVTAAEADAAAERLCRRPFDLESEPPLRVRLYTISDDEHLLAICLHHIAGDGTSMT